MPVSSKRRSRPKRRQVGSIKITVGGPAYDIVMKLYRALKSRDPDKIYEVLDGITLDYEVTINAAGNISKVTLITGVGGPTTWIEFEGYSAEYWKCWSGEGCTIDRFHGPEAKEVFDFLTEYYEHVLRK